MAAFRQVTVWNNAKRVSSLLKSQTHLTNNRKMLIATVFPNFKNKKNADGRSFSKKWGTMLSSRYSGAGPDVRLWKNAGAGVLNILIVFYIPAPCPLKKKDQDNIIKRVMPTCIENIF